MDFTFNIENKQYVFPVHDDNLSSFVYYFLLQTGKENIAKVVSENKEFYNTLFPVLFEKKISKSTAHLAKILYENNISSLLNIGSGLGVQEILLAQYFPNIKFLLVDKNTFEKPSLDSYVSDNHYPFYNTWNYLMDAIDILKLNKNNFTILDPDDDWPLSDLIYSRFSYCWHYSKDKYWSKILKILKPNTSFLITILNRPDRDFVKEISVDLQLEAQTLVNYNSFTDSSFSPFIHEINHSIGGLYYWNRESLPNTGS